MPQQMPLTLHSNIYNFIDKVRNSKFARTVTFIILSLFIFSFFIIFNSQSKYIKESPAFQSNSIIVPPSGKELHQKVTPLTPWINGISLQFGTFARVNHGILHVSFTENDQIIKRWQIPLQELQDNGYQNFYFDKKIHTELSKNYYITVREDYATPDDAVAIYAEDFSGHSEKKGNNESVETDHLNCDNKVLCSKTLIQHFALRKKVTAAALVLLCILMGLIILRVKETVIMSFLIIVTGILWLLVSPGNAVPDETPHLYRAFDISSGNFLANKSLSARTLPKAILGFFSHGTVHIFSKENSRIDWKDTENMPDSAVALYSPLSYVPQAAAIYVSGLFTDKVKILFYAARTAGLVLSILFTILAIRIIPFGKKIIFLLAISPMAMQEMISLSPDGVLIGLSFFIFSFILKLAFDENNVSMKDILAISVLFLLLSQYKVLYFPLVFLVFLIPDKNYACKAHKHYLCHILPACAIACALLWILIVRHNNYLIEFRPGVNSAKQVLFILTHPLAFYKAIIRASAVHGAQWLSQIAGNCLGLLNITLPETFVFTVIILYCYETCTANDIPSMSFINKGILLGSSLIIVLLIFAALYIQWTPLGLNIIEGIQGRYFIPVIPEILFFVQMMIKDRRAETGTASVSAEHSTYSYIIMLIYNMAAMLQVAFFYNYVFI